MHPVVFTCWCDRTLPRRPSHGISRCWSNWHEACRSAPSAPLHRPTCGGPGIALLLPLRRRRSRNLQRAWRTLWTPAAA